MRDRFEEAADLSLEHLRLISHVNARQIHIKKALSNQNRAHPSEGMGSGNEPRQVGTILKIIDIYDHFAFVSEVTSCRELQEETQTAYPQSSISLASHMLIRDVKLYTVSQSQL